jgi:hypothetical protein
VFSCVIVLIVINIIQIHLYLVCNNCGGGRNRTAVCEALA